MTYDCIPCKASFKDKYHLTRHQKTLKHKSNLGTMPSLPELPTNNSLQSQWITENLLPKDMLESTNWDVEIDNIHDISALTDNYFSTIEFLVYVNWKVTDC